MKNQIEPTIDELKFLFALTEFAANASIPPVNTDLLKIKLIKMMDKRET
jgi:hypothetical protein